MVTEIKEQIPPVIEPVANPEPIAPVELPFSRESETYKILRDKGMDDAKILDLYKTAKANFNPRKEVQAPTPALIQEPVKIEDKNQTFKLPDQQDQKKVEPAEIEPLPISEYQDNSTERQNQIVSNLNQYRTSNPEYMKDFDTFKKTFSYDMRIPEQKQVLDTWYKGYQRWVELDSISSGDIVNRYNKNITATDLEQLKLQNPVKYKEVKETLDKKTVLDSLKSELYGNDTTIQEPVKVEEPVKQGNFFDEYRKTINSDEVKWYKTELSNKAGEIKQLQLDLATIKKDVEKQYEGTGASRSKINAIIADQQTEINNKLSALGIDYQTTLDKYNSIVNTAKETMELGLKQQQAELAAKDQKMKELWFYYEYDPKGMQERATAKYNIDNPDMDSTNPATQKQALNQTLSQYYKDYGMIIGRPQAQVINDILNYAKSKWISVSQALKENFITPLQNKSEYKAMLNKQLGIEDQKRTYTTDPETWEIKIQVSWVWQLPSNISFPTGWNLDFRWYSTQYPNEASLKNNNPAWITYNSTFAKTLENNWISYTKWTARPSAEWWNYFSFPTIKEGMAAYNLLRNSPSYSNMTVQKALDRRGTGSLSWVPKNTLVKDLTEEQKTKLQMAQIKKESPWMFKVMSEKWMFWGGDIWVDYNTAFSLLSFPTAVKSEQELKNIKDLVASGKTDAVKSKIINLAVNNIEWAESKKDYQSTYTMLWTLDKIQLLLDKAKELWVPTWYLSWKYEDITNRFWESKNPDVVRLWTALKDQLDALRRWRSGAALTEFEEQFYNSIFPSAWKKYNLNTANINWLKDSRKMLFKTYLQNAYTEEIADQLIWKDVWQPQVTTRYSNVNNQWAGNTVSSIYDQAMNFNW